MSLQQHTYHKLHLREFIEAQPYDREVLEMNLDRKTLIQ